MPLPPACAFDGCPVLGASVFRLVVALCEFVAPPPHVLGDLVCNNTEERELWIDEDGDLMLDSEALSSANQDEVRFLPGAVDYLMARAGRLLTAHEVA